MPKKILEKQRDKISGNFSSNVYNTKGEIVGKMLLPSEIFGVKASQVLLAQAVRVYLANQRLGTHMVKTRTLVAGSTRKIYKQKGTGRARHGDIKAPIFIGGGVAHGPKIRNYSLDFPKKMKRIALFAMLSQKYTEGKIKIVTGLENISQKTREFSDTLSHLAFYNKTKHTCDKVLLILPTNIENIKLAGRNVRNIHILEAYKLNPYEIMNHEHLLFMKDSIERLKNIFLTKGKKELEKHNQPHLHSSSLNKPKNAVNVRPIKDSSKKKGNKIKIIKKKVIKKT